MADTNVDFKFVNWENLKYFWNCAKDYINDKRNKGIINITYSDLKILRDNSQLVVGQMYRITDYVTTTVQSQTKSANHPFDIIVTALNKNTLDEKVSAIVHEGDTYFNGNDLGAWELWYDLDNDTEKYEWVDAINGKGVIYHMIDEKRNDCPYDFKNILFYNDKLTSHTTHDKYYYTFSYVVSDKLYDGTVEKQVPSCTSNSMGVNIKNTKKQLNENVFRNTSFANDCSSNTFGDNCTYNTFENNCSSNKFGDNCSSNTFGDACNSNTFGNYCTSNTFDSYCTSNTFDSYCNSNIFNRHCDSNKFGYYCELNTFGNNCYYNTFGNNCTSNIFSNYCYSNAFGDDCHFNIFGVNCHSNTFGNNYGYKYLDYGKTSIILNNEYYDDGSGQLVPIKHPDLSTQPSILPYKFMEQYVYEQLIPVKKGDRVVSCGFMVEHPMILSARMCGTNLFKNVDIIAAKSDAILLNTGSESMGYINIKYTDDPTPTRSSISTDFGLSHDGTIYIYDPSTETLSLYNSEVITQNSLPPNIPLKNIIFGEGVKGIDGYTFQYCSDLTSITIPDGVMSIGEHAFSRCVGLTTITCKAITPPSAYTTTFEYIKNNSIIVYVPAKSIAAYKAATGWKDFTNIQAI